MSKRALVPHERLRALTIAASQSPCRCLDEHLREHDGRCISCWALARNIERVRLLVKDDSLSRIESLRTVLSGHEAERDRRTVELARRGFEVPR